MLIVCVMATMTPSCVSAQSSCDSLDIVSIQYSATDSGLIEITVLNSSTEIFGYPSFILYNSTGDTLAKETVNFFGIGGGEQTHFMQVLPGVQLPLGPFNATIELYAGFGSTLMCSWAETVNLCPSGICHQAIIYLTNTGALNQFAATWTMFDDGGQTVDQGVIWMDTSNHTHFDTVCLPPGSYELEIFGFFQVTSDLILGITNDYSHSIGTNTHQQNDTTYGDLSFTWYGACVDNTNSIEESESSGLDIGRSGNELIVQLRSGDVLQYVELLDLHGRQVRSKRAFTSSPRLDVSGLSRSVYMIRATVGDKMLVAKVSL